MQHSDQFGDIAAALASAQGKMDHAAKDRANPAFKSKYADLASVLDACRPHLSAHEIAIIQPPAITSSDERAGGMVRVETWLIHKSGQWFATTLEAAVPDIKAQTIGSAITYLRRYGLSAMAGIAPDDDDGNGATGRAGRDEAPRGRDEVPLRVHVQAAPTQPSASKTPAEAAAEVTRKYPGLFNDVSAVLSGALSDEAKLAELRRLYAAEKARTGSPALARVRALVEAGRTEDPTQRDACAEIVREYTAGTGGRIEGLSEADIATLGSLLESIINSAVAA